MMTPEEIEKMKSQGGTMPMMSEEEKQIFTNLLNRGVPEDMIIEIMASAKVGESVADMTLQLDQRVWWIAKDRLLPSFW